MWPRYRKNSTSTEVSRASHTHQAPHIGLPQMLPVSRQSAVKPAPTGPISTAARSASGCRHTSDRTEHSGQRQIAGRSQPGRRDVDVHDPHRVALLPVGRARRTGPRPGRSRSSQAPAAASHGSTAPDRRRKRPGLAKRCRERPGFRSLGGGATTELASTAINLLHASLRLKAADIAQAPRYRAAWNASEGMFMPTRNEPIGGRSSMIWVKPGTHQISRLLTRAATISRFTRATPNTGALSRWRYRAYLRLPSPRIALHRLSAPFPRQPANSPPRMRPWRW